MVNGRPLNLIILMNFEAVSNRQLTCSYVESDNASFSPGKIWQILIYSLVALTQTQYITVGKKKKTMKTCQGQK